MNVLLPLLLAATPAPVLVPGTVQPVVSDSVDVTSVGSCGDRAFFRVTDGRSGSQIWASDGTAQGTRLVAENFVAPSSWSVFCGVGSSVAFGEALSPALTLIDGAGRTRTTTLRDGVTRMQVFEGALWMGGSSGGYRMTLADGVLRPLALGSRFDPIRRVGRHVFVSEPRDLDYGLGRFDETTHQLNEVPWRLPMSGSKPGFSRDAVWFQSYGYEQDGGIYRSYAPFDTAERVVPGFTATVVGGVSRGAILLRGNQLELFPEFGDTPTALSRVSFPQETVELGDALFFYDFDSRRLWRTDGTPGGTNTIDNLQSVGNLVATSEVVFLTATSSASHGPGTYATDGITTVPISSTPLTATPLGDRALFALDGGIYVATGRTPGMTVVRDLRDQGAVARAPVAAAAGSALTWIEPVAGGFEWRATDGSDAGAWSLGSVPEALPDSGVRLRSIGDLSVLIVDRACGRMVARTDGTSKGTRRLVVGSEREPLVGDVLPTDEALYFATKTQLTRVDLDSGDVQRTDWRGWGAQLGSSVYWIEPTRFGTHVLRRLDAHGATDIGWIETPVQPELGRVNDHLCVFEGSRRWSVWPSGLRAEADGAASWFRVQIGPRLFDFRSLDAQTGELTAIDCVAGSTPVGIGTIPFSFRTRELGPVTLIESITSAAKRIALLDHRTLKLSERSDLVPLRGLTATANGTLYAARQLDLATGTEPVVGSIDAPGFETLADLRPGPMPSHPQGFVTTPERDFFWAYTDLGLQLHVIHHVAPRPPVPPPFDAGTPDAGLPDSGTEEPPPTPGRPRGCGCSTGSEALGLLALVWPFARRRRWPEVK